VGFSDRPQRWSRALVKTGALASLAVTAHVAVNLRKAPRPHRPHANFTERVSVLIPARNEAHRIGPTLTALLAQKFVPHLEIIVYDDASTDGTDAVIHSIAQGDPRVRVITNTSQEPPEGWLGKPWACHQLAQEATGDIFMFLDADVVLEPWAVAGAAFLLRDSGAHLISPWPRQIATSAAERVTQPMLNWAWLSLVPVWLAMHSSNPWWVAANGQFLVFDARAYRQTGGHTRVSDQVIEDMTLMFHVRDQGFRASPAIGADIASCRMYTSAHEVYEGYTKSLWSISSSTFFAAGVGALAAVVFVLPPAAALASRHRNTRRWGALGYASSTLGRVAIAHRMGERAMPDAFAHPVSVMAFVGILGASGMRHRRGTLRWKDRPIDEHCEKTTLLGYATGIR
jgi:hypothetical protein